MKTLARVATIVFLLDQISKWLVVRALGLREVGEIDVAAPYLTFRMAWNRGINFGLLGNDGDATRWILTGIAVAISVWVVLWVRRAQMPLPARISAGLLVGGALGNAFDRVVYGAVADFLNMSCCGVENPFSFNIADLGVFAGAIGLVLFSEGNKTP